jgi:hypothetical protein
VETKTVINKVKRQTRQDVQKATSRERLLGATAERMQLIDLLDKARAGLIAQTSEHAR